MLWARPDFPRSDEMSVVVTILLVVQVLSALIMIGLILLQQGKGADMGAAFGSGSSGSLFGASGGASFLSRTTGVLAAVFFSCTLALAYFGNVKSAGKGSVLEGVQISAPVEQPGVQQIPGVDRSIPVPTGPATTDAARQIPGK
jgi:preprotein translocase subunit SecG